MSRPGCGRQRGGSPKLASRQRPSPSSSAGVSRGEAVDREPTRARTPVILVASDVALPAAHRGWGTGGWLPPEERGARTWHCREALTASALTLSRAASSWAALEGAPIVVARSVGRGMVATLAFHPSVARDVDGAVTALLKHLLIWAAQTPVAWIDLEGSLVLRMDDPGGSQNVHLQSWSYPKLREADWAAIAADLKRRQARVGIGYVGGWGPR